MITTHAIALAGDEERWAVVGTTVRARGHAEHDRFSQTGAGSRGAQ